MLKNMLIVALTLAVAGLAWVSLFAPEKKQGMRTSVARRLIELGEQTHEARQSADTKRRQRHEDTSTSKVPRLTPQQRGRKKDAAMKQDLADRAACSEFGSQQSASDILKGINDRTHDGDNWLDRAELLSVLSVLRSAHKFLWNTSSTSVSEPVPMPARNPQPKTTTDTKKKSSCGVTVAG